MRGQSRRVECGSRRDAGHRVTGKRTRRAKGAGWERVHVRIDDTTRLASTATRYNGPQRYLAGWTSVTSADRTALSATGRPGLALPS